jgi:asparaginyl-tRNA synthetase
MATSVLQARDIGRSLSVYQAGLGAQGSNFSAAVRSRYAERWMGTGLCSALKVRTSLVLALHEFLSGRGLLNIDRVSLSPITDPLAHGVEHVPIIDYKGVSYRTTHSMIYSKMLACFNKELPGIFVDSPNIRLEEAAASQRGKYLVDFSQMDIEMRRSGRIGEEMYRKEPEAVSAILAQERDRALDFFEDMIVFAVEKILERDKGELADLGVELRVPAKPFPRIRRDDALKEFGADIEKGEGLEKVIGRKLGLPFFWILGLFRENYDLVYPYEPGDAQRSSEVPSSRIFNYDLAAASLSETGKQGGAYEVLSGGLREWIYPVIVKRLIDNGVIREEPRFSESGDLENIEALEGYGPFLAAARLKDKDGLPLFPETCGGGLGLERFLFAILKGPVVKTIDDVTLFGKNPDSADVYLF